LEFLAALKDQITPFMVQIFFLKAYGRPTDQKMVDFYNRSYGKISYSMASQLGQGVQSVISAIRRAPTISILYSYWQIPVPQENQLEQLFSTILKTRYPK